MLTVNAPIEDLNVDSTDPIDYFQFNKSDLPEGFYRCKNTARMLQIKQHHTICQEYLLPIPYHCQIYHLLNLKHLELVHGFSLNGLKIGNAIDFEATKTGGTIKFQTMLVSSFNFLRIWRQPVVEVELTLHNAYTID